MKKYIRKGLTKIGVWNAYISLKKSLYRNRDIWKLRTKILSVDYLTSDSYSWHWFYPRYSNGKIHEPFATKIFQEHIKETDTIFDIGSHLGYFTCIAGKLAPKGTVHAFEVDPKCVELIKNNSKHNELNNIVINNLAVSDNNDFVEIMNLETPNPGLVINSKIEKSSLTVESTTLDDYIIKSNVSPNFIKIDVEGAEAKVLKGMKHLLTQKHLTILLEIHVNHLRRYFNTNYKDILETLEAHEFKIRSLEHRKNKNTLQEVTSNTTLEGNIMLLCEK